MSRIFQEQEARRALVEQVRENSTRPGRAFAHYTNSGSGQTVEPTVFEFGTSFIDLPVFTFGATLDEDTAVPDTFPFYQAGVYQWRRTANGFYTGAWCWFYVEEFMVGGEFKLVFSLAWEAYASKDFISTKGFPVNTLDI